MEHSSTGVVRAVMIEDHEMIGEAISVALSADGIEVVGLAATLAEGVALVVATDPDIVLLDLRLPDAPAAGGLDVVRQASPDVPVLVLSAAIDDATAVDLLSSGAAGVLHKDAPLAELTRAVRAAAAGETVLPPALAGRVIARLREANSTTAALTDRELEALRLLSAGSGIDRVAEAMVVSRNTARKHVQAVLQKLNAHSQLEAVAEGRRRGLIG